MQKSSLSNSGLASEKTKIIVPWWAVGLVTVTTLLFIFGGAIYATFSVAGSTVSKTDYASAFMMLFFGALAGFIAAIGLGIRRTSVIPVLASILLLLMSISAYQAIDGAASFVFISTDPNIYVWFLIALLFATPLAAVGMLAAWQQDSAIRLLTCITIATIVPLTTLLVFVVPLQKEVSNEYGNYSQEVDSNIRATQAEDAQEAEADKKQQAVDDDLTSAAQSVVVAISNATDTSGRIPSTIAAPNGYTLAEYGIVNKSRVQFCLKAIDVIDRSTYLGVYVDPTVSSGTMYWHDMPAVSCRYSYDNFMQLK